MDRSEIIIIEGKSITDMAQELCKKAGLARMIRTRCPRKEPRIALKPNLLGPIPAEDGATTHPQVVEGVLLYLRQNGFSDLVVMESSWVGDRTADSLLVTGFGDLCKRMGVPFLDLQEDRGVAVNAAGMELNICERVLTADYLINLPVLKGHCQTAMTCALKNMKGCIPASEKRRFHRLGLHKPIGHLSAAIRQDFILADAICPDLSFEDGGSPVKLDRLLCAADPVLLDAYGMQAIGLSLKEVRYISVAQECGVGNSDTSGAKISFFLEKEEDGKAVYLNSAPPALPWDRDPGRSVIGLKEIVHEVDSCSACYGTLIPVLKRLDEEGLLDKIPGKICIGQGYRGCTGELGVGNCTSRFRCTLQGCPPSAEEMYMFLKGVLSRQSLRLDG